MYFPDLVTIGMKFNLSMSRPINSPTIYEIWKKKPMYYTGKARTCALTFSICFIREAVNTYLIPSAIQKYNQLFVMYSKKRQSLLRMDKKIANFE